jgi:hypothetical protein
MFVLIQSNKGSNLIFICEEKVKNIGEQICLLYK